jgi:hypothetical protein
LRLMVVAAVSLSGLACSLVIDKEISQVSRATCPDGEPLQASRSTTETGRISASWSCAAPADCAEPHQTGYVLVALSAKSLDHGRRDVFTPRARRHLRAHCVAWGGRHLRRRGLQPDPITHVAGAGMTSIAPSILAMWSHAAPARPLIGTDHDASSPADEGKWTTMRGFSAAC